jgi:hypothetical protein
VSSLAEGFEYHVTGSGNYAQGGEVALLQEMELTVQVNDDPDNVLASGKVPFPEGVSFPAIDIRLEHRDPKTFLHVYSLHLVAKPSGEPPPVEFRRGDSNGDGSADISDAVHILLWRFSGGAEPGCVDAADTNDDEQVDLTDAVFLLDYLFRGGPVPPAPGSNACGPQASGAMGCASYPAC